MPRGRRGAQNATVSAESEALEAKPKRKRTRKTHEPAPLADALDELVERIPGLTTASRLEPPVAEQPPPQTEIVTAPEREPIRHTEAGIAPESAPPLSHVERLSQRGLRPTPSGFLGMEGHYHAGIRLSRSLDKMVVSIQFADDQRPSRHGAHPEVEQLQERGFSYRPERGQWERTSRNTPASPADNYQDAKAFVKKLVDARLAEPQAGVGRA